MGKRRVDLMFLGRAHTAGDIIAYVPDQNVMFTGDIVEYHSACYCGDGHFSDWPMTPEEIRAFDLDAIAPGRGDALVGSKMAMRRSTTRQISSIPPTARSPASPRAVAH
jgi:glyoxylase-like metal-dependent hydrolase (beta-lactamase superfamily II)